MVSLKLSRTTRHKKLRATGLSSRIRTLTAISVASWLKRSC
jgi:hypothetical protein